MDGGRSKVSIKALRLPVCMWFFLLHAWLARAAPGQKLIVLAKKNKKGAISIDFGC